MSKSITIDQSHAIMAALATNVDWTQLDSGLLQEQIIKNPREAAKHFNRFLQNGARILVLDDFKIATVLFDPASFIDKGWQEIVKERDERSAKLTEVDFVKVRFIHYLKEGESFIRGGEFLRRLRDTDDILLGANAFMGLWLDNQAKKEKSVIEHLYQEGRINGWLYFFGTVLMGPAGDHGVLCLYRNDGEWDWQVRGLTYGLDVRDLSAVLSQTS